MINKRGFLPVKMALWSSRCLADAKAFPQKSHCRFLSLDVVLSFIVKRTVFLGFGDDGALDLDSNAVCSASDSTVQSTCRNRAIIKVSSSLTLLAISV